MSRKFWFLTLSAAVVSALLLFAGTTVLGFFTPVSADGLPALVVGKRAQDAAVQVNSQGADDTPTPVSPTQTPAVTLLPDPSGTPFPQVTPTAQSTVVNGVSVTIAQLLANPRAYLNQMVSVSGLVSLISSERFLLNDGTGQLVVDVEEEGLVGPLSSGMFVTVVGRLDDSNSDSLYKIEACTVTDNAGKVWVNRCHNGDDDESEDSHSITRTPDDDDDDSDDDHNSQSTPEPTHSDDDHHDDNDDDHDDEGTPEPTRSGDDDHEKEDD